MTEPSKMARRVACMYLEKQSATLQQIERGLAPGIIQRSRALKPLERDASFWKVGEHEVRVEQSGPDYRFSCSCPFWVYQGPEYHALRGGYLRGRSRGSASPPRERDPRQQHRVCKHVLAVMRRL